MGNQPNQATKDKPNMPGVAGDPNCPYCRKGKIWGWPFEDVFHTHDPSKPLTNPPSNPPPNLIVKPKYHQTVVIDPLTYLLPNVEVNPAEVEQANTSMHHFFQGTDIDPKIHFNFEFAIDLAKLSKFRIQKSFNMSEATEKMLFYAKSGSFPEAFRILDKFPAIVNFIPPNRAWGVLHQAAYFNNDKAVEKILENPKCDPFLRTKQARDGKVAPSSTAYMIATDDNVKKIIEKYQKIKTEQLEERYKPTFVFINSEEEIEVESILLTLNCFENVLHSRTLSSKHSLIYSNLMLDIFNFINAGSNWKRARREVSLQLQSIDIYAANFLATGDGNKDIMDEVIEAKTAFYSRVIHLYTQEYNGSNLYRALNVSLRIHGCNRSFISGEDLALAAYGILLNSILMYWGNLQPTNEPTFRGMDLPPEVITQYNEGQTFTWLCFTSSSITQSFSGNCKFIFDNTQGTKYAAKGIREHSKYQTEEEYLYPSGARFRIISIEAEPAPTTFTFRIRLEDY